MISATGAHRDEGFRYAIDNGAWTAYQDGLPWGEGLFVKLLETHGARADFVVVPDIVCGGMASLKFSESWLPRLGEIRCPRLIAVQDGMAPWDIEPLLGRDVGIFVGGSTDSDFGPDVSTYGGGWKWRSLRHWAQLARAKRAYIHVGRVNSVQRIKECVLAGVDSFDGTNATIFSVNQPQLDAASRQGALIGDAMLDEEFE